MLQNAKARSRKNGIEFSLGKEWAIQKLKAGVCEASGLAFDFTTHEEQRAFWIKPRAPSIERIDPEGPYSEENCEMILWLLNRAKAKFDRVEFDNIMIAYVSRIKTT